MRPAKKIEKYVQNIYTNKFQVTTTNNFDERVISNIMNTVEEQKTKMSTTNQTNIWRIIMNNRITKFAAAAVVLAAVVLSITIFDNTAQEAYAIEQSIKASHTVETLRIRFSKSTERFDFDEAYMKYGPLGKLESARLDAAQSPDGPKTIVWSNNIAKVWMHSKKGVLVIREPEMAKEMEEMAVKLDPKRTLQNLYEMQQKGEQDLKITEPEEEGDLITIEVVHDKGREVFYVDPESKLLVRFEMQALNGQDYVVTNAMEISGYNEPIDENVFTLGDLPNDVFVLDQVNQEIGLVQGDLSDDEIVVEVATQFFQALIDEDYAKAALLVEGISADQLKQAFSGQKFVRFAPIGKIVPHSDPLTGGLSIPCEIEYTLNSQTITQTGNLNVRKVQGRPDRWIIFGFAD